jgi:hypothetical protein
MPRGYAGPDDPDKGMPHRHTRQKIRLLLTGPSTDLLEKMLLKVAEKYPDAVLDAVTDTLAQFEQETTRPDEEFMRNAAVFISRNDELLRQLNDGEGEA